MFLSNAESVPCRTHTAVSRSVILHQQQNRLLNFHEVRNGIPLTKALKQASVLFKPSHTFTLRQFILLSFKHQTNKTVSVTVTILL